MNVSAPPEAEPKVHIKPLSAPISLPPLVQGYEALFELSTALYKVLSTAVSASAVGFFAPDPADPARAFMLSVARNAGCRLHSSPIPQEAFSAIRTEAPYLTIPAARFPALPEPFRSCAGEARFASFEEYREAGLWLFVLHGSESPALAAALEAARTAAKDLVHARAARRPFAEHAPAPDFQALSERAALANARYLCCFRLPIAGLARSFALKRPSAIPASLGLDLLALVRAQLSSTGTAYPGKGGSIAVLSFARTRPDPELIAQVIRRSLERELGLDPQGSQAIDDGQVIDLETDEALAAWQAFREQLDV